MKQSVAIIGGGSAAIIFAAMLDEKKFDVSIYEKNNSLARKFLVAGSGGLNLTHAEPINQLIQKYIPQTFLENALLGCTNVDLQNWFLQLGIQTYIGSSNRVYPVKNVKPIQVFNAILSRLKLKNVHINTNHLFINFDLDKNCIFNIGNQQKVVNANYIIFALGGASWSITGSDGYWTTILEEKNIQINPFQASNCSFKIHWQSDFIFKYNGFPLKNISISCNGISKKGELVITKFGLEGGAIYALSPQIRNQLDTKGFAIILIDLKPNANEQQLLQIVINKKYKNTSTILKEDFNLSNNQIALIKSIIPKDVFIDKMALVKSIKSLPLIVTASAPIDEAISTVGGILLSEVDKNFQLNKLPNVYAIGEMLDWDAPTGGYLLQACFSMANHLATHLNSK